MRAETRVRKPKVLTTTEVTQGTPITTKECRVAFTRVAFVTFVVKILVFVREPYACTVWYASYVPLKSSIFS